MQIVVNHLTRMRTRERICIAGINLERGRHVRPVTPKTDLLTEERRAARAGGGCRHRPAVAGSGSARDGGPSGRNWKYAIDEGDGRASLAVVKAWRPPELEVGRYGKLQLRFNDLAVPTFLSVADIRFVEADHTTIRTPSSMTCTPGSRGAWAST